MLDDLFKRTKHLVQQSVECKLKQMLKPFKWALRVLQWKFSLQHHCWIKYQGQDNKENHCKMKKLLIVKFSWSALKDIYEEHYGEYTY